MPTTRGGLKTMRGRTINEWPILQRPKMGRHRGVHIGARTVRGIVKLTVHRRGIYWGKANIEPKDPREQFAVPKSEVKGTLPERIFFKSLLDRHLVPNSDFSFQSSMDGGRLQLGGMVCDFIINASKTVVRINGLFWHGRFDAITGSIISGDIVQARVDDSQRMILEGYGYQVLDLFEDICYDQFLLEHWLERWIDPILLGHNA